MAKAVPAHSLPAQPSDVPWPTEAWPGFSADAVSDAEGFTREMKSVWSSEGRAEFGKTLALLVVQRGRLVYERYDPRFSADRVFHSWSIAKSFLHAAIGILVGDERLDPEEASPVPAWSARDDPRRAIRLEDLLRMVDGLDFVEHDPESGRVDVVDMLAGAGKADAAAYAEARPLHHAPGRYFNYSSGSSLVVAGILGRALGGGRDVVERFLRTRMTRKLGIRSFAPRFDSAGTFLASSYANCTARDFARFGLLYLRDGIWEDRRVLPAGWVDHARTETPASLGRYGAHWWLATDGSGIFTANGFRGQYIALDPVRDLAIVRLGNYTEEQRVNVVRSLRRIFDCFPATS